MKACQLVSPAACAADCSSFAAVKACFPSGNFVAVPALFSRAVTPRCVGGASAQVLAGIAIAQKQGAPRPSAQLQLDIQVLPNQKSKGTIILQWAPCDRALPAQPCSLSFRCSMQPLRSPLVRNTVMRFILQLCSFSCEQRASHCCELHCQAGTLYTVCEQEVRLTCAERVEGLGSGTAGRGHCACRLLCRWPAVASRRRPGEQVLWHRSKSCRCDAFGRGCASLQASCVSRGMASSQPTTGALAVPGRWEG